MKTYNVAQGSDEWLQMRLGIPSASNFSRIITPKEMKPSKSQDGYLAELVAEWWLGCPLDSFQSGFTERGTHMEDEARRYYAATTDDEVTRVGWCTSDDGAYGCSPDSLVGADGLLELKCPSAAVHMAYLLNPDSLKAEYWCQCQGQLLVTGRKWNDLCAYHPVFPAVVVRILPDPKFQAALSDCLAGFATRLSDAKAAVSPQREALRAERAQPGPNEDVGTF